MRTEFLKTQLQRNAWLLANEKPPLRAGDFFWCSGNLGRVVEADRHGYLLNGGRPVLIGAFTRQYILAALIDDAALQICTICERDTANEQKIAVPLIIENKSTQAIVLVCRECAKEHGRLNVSPENL